MMGIGKKIGYSVTNVNAIKNSVTNPEYKSPSGEKC